MNVNARILDVNAAAVDLDVVRMTDVGAPIADAKIKTTDVVVQVVDAKIKTTDAVEQIVDADVINVNLDAGIMSAVVDAETAMVEKKSFM